MRLIQSFILLFLLLYPNNLNAQAIKVGPIKAQRGEVISGFLEIKEGVDEGANIPISIINGVSDGPVLALIAGTHGYEYPPITALQNIRQKLSPKSLSGSIIIVHVANIPSFLKRTIYYNPVDGKNLNRVYPGNKDGTLSERIAYTITNQVIKKADYLVDMHGGDGNEALMPYIYMPDTNNEAINKAVKGMAEAFGTKYIVIDKTKIPKLSQSTYVDATGLSLGIPSITTETGKLGQNTKIIVDIAENGVWNLLRHLKMIEGKNIPRKPVIWLHDYKVITSPENGFFRASVHEESLVYNGEIIGELFDFFGNLIKEIKAPYDGILNYVVGTPPVSKGEPVAMISKIRKEINKN
ncbi:MAG: M14 family metallopeptidase [Sphingomonadales bacterium]